MLSAELAKAPVRGWTARGKNGSALGGDGHALRAELFSVSQLERHARMLAGQHELALSRPGRPRLLERLGENQLLFREVYALLTDAVERGLQVSPAAEWFIDNHHLIEDQIQTARRHLPKAYHRELPRLANALVPGTPRVYDLVIELISHSHGRVDQPGLLAFVESYQSLQPLKLGELWAIPIMLRLALLENLRRVVASVAFERRERERAAHWVSQLTSAEAKPDLIVVLARLVAEAPALTDAFVAELASRLQSRGTEVALAMSWLEQRLAERGQTIEHAVHLVTQGQAADQVSVSNSIGSLRLLGATDWRVFVESSSLVERILRNDPGGTYAAMDFATRDRYRHAIELIAKRSQVDEADVARVAIRLARERGVHVGTFLITDESRALSLAVGLHDGVWDRVREHATPSRALAYGGSILALTGLFAATLGLVSPNTPALWAFAPWWFALVLCASMVAIALVHLTTTLLVGPKILPRLDFSSGIPTASRTIVAVPSMLTSKADIDRLVEDLEVRFLANRDPNLSLALLTDFRDAPTETTPTDAALLQHAVDAIDTLNLKYSTQASGAPSTPPFYLAHRARTWNGTENAWMGWERKRGKLEDFNELLRGSTGRFTHLVGAVSELTTFRYVIALDADTELPRDAARLLSATLSHPLNRPVFDARLGRVTEGYAVLQPRVGVSMASTTKTRFARLFAGEPGIDPYTRAVSDVFQDLFAEGSFVGKGIYDVDMVRTALAGRLPDNRVLSHDLLEGAYARAGLVSDVELVEDFPSSHAAEVARSTRWIRGDWQIASWLLPNVPAPGRPIQNPTSWLSRWKIFDNLRRSLTPIALMTLLLGGWFMRDAAAFATLSTALILLLPGLLVAVTALMRRPEGERRGLHLRELLRSASRQLGRESFALATLPYDAIRAARAIATTLGRLLFTRRHLLVWRTASDAQRGARIDLMGTLAALWTAPASALATAVALGLSNPEALGWASPVLLAWLFSPLVVWWMSRPLVAAPIRLSAKDRLFLRGVARRTWRFFETFVGPRDHFLPPDNYQEEPPVGVAHRTSPTNMGLALIANLAAHDLGYLTLPDLIGRLGPALDTMSRLARFRGHFLNWYDTTTLAPLEPMYVSTVDSGNLSAHLLTLAAGLDELATRPILGHQLVTGLEDTLDQVSQLTQWPSVQLVITSIRAELERARSATSMSARRRHLEALAQRSHELTVAVRARCESPSEPLEWATSFESACRSARLALSTFAPWLDAPELPDELDRELPLLAHSRLPHTTPHPPGLHAALVAGAAEATLALTHLQHLAARCRALADFECDFLYDRARQLLAIGYHVGDQRTDLSFYDLLASESRLASFVAIASGKLPQEHWFSLGRQLTVSHGRPTLVSWSGSMFEYLMPLLVMPSYEHTLLDETSRAAVARQIAYGRELDLPWGVTESGYNKVDAGLSYQYRAFGVPGLGFKRGLADDRVITPYASALALMVSPEAATQNLQRLAASDQLGAYGFYEAMDHTHSRLPPGRAHVTIQSYMAHHQGMIFLSLVHLLCERPMQRRFDADPAFRATNLLLQERVPRTTTVLTRPPAQSAAVDEVDSGAHRLRVYDTAATFAPEVHLLSNGAYHVVVTNSGGGYSRWRDLAITRWREDTTRDCWGAFGYLRDLGTGAFWSVAHHPTRRIATHYEAIFSPGRAEFRRLDGDIYTHVEISVSPEDDVELRRVSLTNRGDTRRTLELTSYAEVVLASAASDLAHPAFSNLFVQTEILADPQAILVTRRPRSKDERPPWMFHHLSVHGTPHGEPSFETARATFIGRGRTPADPIAMHRPDLTGSHGAVLDPIVAIRAAILLEPQETACLHVVTGVAETREGALTLLEKFRDRHAATRVLELSWTHSQVVQRRLSATDLDIQTYERLATHIIFSNPTMRAPAGLIARNRGGQSGLWAYGISGDLPIMLVRIADFARLDLVEQLVKAHAYWRYKGLGAELVIWIEDPSGYRQTLMDEIVALIAGVSETAWLDKPGGIFVRRSEQISEPDKILMCTLARVLVSDSAGTLAEQMERLPDLHQAALSRGPEADLDPFPTPHAVSPRPTPRGTNPERPDLLAFNGLGGFTPDGREYIIATDRDRKTATPWVNVIANPFFGTIISESGSAYTWCENAHSYRLTPWSNDPVSDPSGESFYLRDESDGHLWSPTPSPAGPDTAFTSRHGFGYSIFECVERGLASTLTTYVATDAPVKFAVLRLENRSGRTRRISLTAYFELVLGEHRATQVPHVVTELDLKTAALTARNAYSVDFSERVAFLDCSESRRTVSGDRAEFIGRNGTLSSPAALRRPRLSGKVGAALDPCLAMQVVVELVDGQASEVAFTFGSGRDLADARVLVTRFRGIGPARHALEGVWAHWSRTLGAVRVKTPDGSLDLLSNGWLLYQVMSSRLWGRSGFYQSGGAFGFRDQLQDAMALVHTEPALLREQLLRAAAHQFREGDVQHWWHPPGGRGVRTTISDDYLWLPLALCRYVGAIGDTGILDERVPFLEGRPLMRHEESYYDLPVRSEDVGTLYEHATRAVKNGLRFGARGLPLMGGGDWNDGMNLVGPDGQGESVWLGFFLYDVLARFAVLADRRGDVAFAEICTSEAGRLRANLEAHAWDGRWYRRAYFDSGAPLGSAHNVECQIDAIPQSWAQLSRAGAPARVAQALASVEERLVRTDLGLIALFEPPFDDGELDPGYVKGYVPGVRENGGQYTHAAVWTVMAFAESGRVEKAWELLDLINPIHHGDSAEAIARYKVEPYVVAADVYVNRQHAGRGGWTWYTGAAGWMYRLIIETLLGLHLEVDRLRFAPKIPERWPGFEVDYRHRETHYHIRVENLGGGHRVVRVTCDGVVQPDASVPLVDDHLDHEVVVEVGA